MYYILEANDIKSVCYLKYSESNGWGTDFLEGCAIEISTAVNNTIRIDFECEKIDLPDYFEVGGVPVTNKKLINIFKDSEISNIQTFAADIYFTNDKVSGYYVVNIAEQNSCIHIETTKSTKFGKHIMRILDLKLDTDTTCTTDIFRDPLYKQIIFISSKIQKAINESNISGCDIRKAEGWNDLHRF